MVLLKLVNRGQGSDHSQREEIHCLNVKSDKGEHRLVKTWRTPAIPPALRGTLFSLVSIVNGSVRSAASSCMFRK